MFPLVIANEPGRAHSDTLDLGLVLYCIDAMPMEVGMCAWWERAALKVKLLCNMTILPCLAGTLESRPLAKDRKGGGRVHLKLDSGLGPIANKYHEGNVRRTLKRKLNVHEIAASKAYDVLSCFTRFALQDLSVLIRVCTATL